MAALKVVQPRTLQTQGSLEGLGLRGTFHTWRDGTKERYDEALGLRVQRTLRLNGVEYAQNANGDVRVFHGLAARRQITEDFIDSGAFAHQPSTRPRSGPESSPTAATYGSCASLLRAENPTISHSIQAPG